MPSDVELEIHSLLLSEDNPRQVLDHLLLDIHNLKYSPSNKNDILILAFHMGAYKQILALLSKWPETHFPWAVFVETLSQMNVQPNRKFLIAIIKVAQKNKQLQELVLTLESQKWGDKFKELRKDSLKKKKLNYETKIKRLKQKLLFLREERIFEEEILVIKKLKELIPEDPELLLAEESFEERWSRNLISQYASQRNKEQALDFCLNQTSAEELDLFEHLKKESKALLSKETQKSDKQKQKQKRTTSQKKEGKQETSLTYDLALMFYFLNSYSEALDIIKDSPEPKEPRLKWLQLELLYLSGQYISCLDLISQLLQEGNEVPEAHFNATYTQALCYWKLKKNSLAIDTIKSLVNVNADYRSAINLLKEWTAV